MLTPRNVWACTVMVPILRESPKSYPHQSRSVHSNAKSAEDGKGSLRDMPGFALTLGVTENLQGHKSICTLQLPF